VPFRVIHSENDPVEALSAASRLTDIIIVSRSSGIAGEVALAARTPVLVLSEAGWQKVPPAKACIAWDGGNEAAMALRSAVPLLARCGSVEVLTVVEKPGGAPPGAAVRYLAKHGIAAESRELPRRGTTEETLANAVRDGGGQLLVMGAYGRGRMREFLFGGVTRYFLENDRGHALLMAH
jgi:nucleotide-binding universal stress UspA family protein